MLKKAQKKAMVEFLSKFDEYPFRIKFKHNDYMVGVGNPAFTVSLKKVIPVSYLKKLIHTSVSKKIRRKK